MTRTSTGRHRCGRRRRRRRRRRRPSCRGPRAGCHPSTHTAHAAAGARLGGAERRRRPPDQARARPVLGLIMLGARGNADRNRLVSKAAVGGRGRSPEDPRMDPPARRRVRIGGAGRRARGRRNAGGAAGATGAAPRRRAGAASAGRRGATATATTRGRDGAQRCPRQAARPPTVGRAQSPPARGRAPAPVVEPRTGGRSSRAGRGAPAPAPAGPVAPGQITPPANPPLNGGAFEIAPPTPMERRRISRRTTARRPRRPIANL